MTSARSRLQTHTAARSSPCRSHHLLSFFLSALVASKPTAVFVLLPKLNHSKRSPFAAEGRQTSCSLFPAFPSALAHCSRPQKADPACPSPVSLTAESPLSLLCSLASKPLAPPLSSTSLSRLLPLSRLGGAYRPERGRKKRELAIHHHRTNNKQPLTPPDTHVTSILPNSLAKHAFNGGSELILYLVA